MTEEITPLQKKYLVEQYEQIYKEIIEIKGAIERWDIYSTTFGGLLDFCSEGSKPVYPYWQKIAEEEEEEKVPGTK